MLRRPPISTRTYTLFPDTTLFRSDAVAPHDDAAAGGVTVHDQVPMAPPRPQEFPADPQQVLRVLIFQGPPRFDPGVNEEVVARFVEQLQFPQEGEVRGRDRCAQPLAGTVGGKRSDPAPRSEEHTSELNS